MRSRVPCSLAFLFLVASGLRAQTAAEEGEILRKAGVPRDAVGLTTWIQTLCLPAEKRAEAERLIEQLGDDKFALREKAAAALVKLGPSVLPLVEKATKSTDPEIRRRATNCAQLLQRRVPDPVLVEVAVRRLETFPTAESVRTLLDLYCSLAAEVPLPTEPLADQVTASLGRVLRRLKRRDVNAVRRTLSDRAPARRCAAAIGLVRAGIEDALPEIRDLLKDRDRGVRLGAAWALARDKEKAAIPVLIALMAGADGYALQAEEILCDLAGGDAAAPMKGGSSAARRRRRDRWQAWWEKNRHRAEVLDRLTWQERKIFVERFLVPARDVTKGYRSLVYEATVPGGAEVRDGRLFLRGDHAPGDQRLVLTSQKMTGKVQWPDQLEIAVKLGGTANESGAWHVGVWVGRVKVLFHPGYSQGAFRVETADTHILFDNENMGFTPAADVLHSMALQVHRVGRTYRFEVTVVEAKGGGRYRKVFAVSSDKMARFDRIGLERSGRRGGDALFETLSIKLGR